MITEDDIITKVETLAATAADPTLDAADLAAAVEDARVADADGRSPHDGDWEGAWDVNLAVSQAWRLKAGKASSYMAFSSDGSSFSTNQIFEHCMRMADWYADRSGVVTYADPDNLPDSPQAGFGWLTADTLYTADRGLGWDYDRVIP